MSQSVSNEPPKNVAAKEVGSTWSKNKGNVNIDLTNLGRPQQQTKAPSMNQLSGNSTPQASPAMTPMMGGMSPMMANPGLVLYKKDNVMISSETLLPPSFSLFVLLDEFRKKVGLSRQFRILGSEKLSLVNFFFQ